MIDPDRTVPRTPAVQPLADDTKPRAAEDSSADPNRTADHAPAETPSGTNTVVRTPSDAARLETAALTAAAEFVPGYVLLGELGRGGMGVVYEARHVKLNRIVALKMMLRAERAGRGELIRFLAEAEAVAAVRHENVVQVYDYGDAEGRPYMALEFCPGGTLGKLLPKEAGAATNPRAMATLIAQVARGVAAAHALGIVHRDLKPGNVFLDARAVPKVADFGLAKRGEGSDVTQAGVGMGTPAYMAPEQARDAKFVGPQADVWALGVILYEALTGTRPFTGTVQEVIAKAQNSEPPAPRKVISAVPRDLELICLHCLSKAPHERYATAKELADDLDRYKRGEPISVRPASPGERAYKWMKRNKVVSGAAAVVFLALSLGLGFSIGFGREANKQAEEAKKQKKDAEDATAREANEKKDAIDARNETIVALGKANRNFAKALFGPMVAGKRDSSRDQTLSPNERESLWQIAQLRGDDVAWMFLEESVRTPLTCTQLVNRADYVFHAALGLNVKRRDAVDQLLLASLRLEPESDQSVSLAQATSLWENSSPTLARKVADILIAALGKETDANARTGLAKDLSAVANRLEPTQAADILVAALGKETDARARAELTRGLSAVANRMEPTQAADIIVVALGKETTFVRDGLLRGLSAVANRMEPIQAAEILVAALNKETNVSARTELARDLSVVANRMEPIQAAKIADILVAALGKETDANARTELARGLSVVANRLEQTQAAKIADILVAALGKETSTFVRAGLLRGLSAMANRMEPTQVAKVADFLVEALGKEKNVYVRAGLANDLSWVANRLEPTQVAKVADTLVSALSKETNVYDRAGLAQGLSSVANRLEPTQIAKVADFLVEALGKETEANARARLARGLSAVANRLEPTQAADILVAALGKETSFYARAELARGLPVVANRLEQTQAAKVADTLVAALGKEKEIFGRAGLAQGLSAVANRLEPTQAAKVSAQAADILVAALDKKTDSFDRAQLARGLATVANRLEPIQAADIFIAALRKEVYDSVRTEWLRGLSAVANRLEPTQAAKVADTLVAALGSKETGDFGRAGLARGLSVVANRLEPTQAAKVSAQAADILVAAFGRQTNTSALAELEQGLSAVARGDTNQAQCVTILAIGAFAMPYNILPPLPLLHPHFQPRPLPAQVLVELLKHPFCVSGARRAVLDALEFTYKRPFKDQWDFVEYAQKQQPQLNLLTPPNRSEPK